MLWSPLFRNITQARRFNILSQVHPDHTGLLSRAAEKLPIGSEDLFGDKFIRELLSQVKVASRVSTSVSATPASASTPIKHSKSRTPASTPATPATGSSHRYDNWYVQPSIFSLTILPDVTVRVAGRTSLFVQALAQLTKDPWVLFPVANGFKLEFSSDPPFQHSAPSNASMDASQLALCSAEVEALSEKGAIVEAGGEDGYISRYFLIPKKGVNKW